MGCQSPFEGFHLQVTHTFSDSIYKLHINALLLLRDAKLLLRDSIHKLYINIVYLILEDAKLLLGDSIYKLYINTVYQLLLRDATLSPFEGSHFQVIHK